MNLRTETLDEYLNGSTIENVPAGGKFIRQYSFIPPPIGFRWEVDQITMEVALTEDGFPADPWEATLELTLDANPLPVSGLALETVTPDPPTVSVEKRTATAFYAPNTAMRLFPTNTVIVTYTFTNKGGSTLIVTRVGTRLAVYGTRTPPTLREA